MKGLKTALTTLILIIPILSVAQESISGSLKVRGTDEPIANAVVFVENTMAVTTTDENGNFKLEDIPDGFKKLIATHPTHKTYSGNLSGVRVMNIQLRPDALRKQVFDKGEKKSKQWKRLFQVFQKAFFGDTGNARQAKINNPEVMELDKDKAGRVFGFSIGMVETENKALGYKIHSLVEKVEIQNKRISLLKRSYFTPLTPSNSSEEAQWKANREKSYLGSKQHFLTSLKRGTLANDGFEIYSAQLDGNTGKFKAIGRLQLEDIYKNDELRFSDFLRVVYTKEPVESNYRNQSGASVAVPNDGQAGQGQVVRGGLEIRNIPESNLRVSYLFNRASKVKLNEYGQANNPNYLAEYGYWNWERIVQELPNEYYLRQVVKDQ